MRTVYSPEPVVSSVPSTGNSPKDGSWISCWPAVYPFTQREGIPMVRLKTAIADEK
ncbi:hypothetical protein D3C75_738990 [compost metagenome]